MLVLYLTLPTALLTYSLFFFFNSATYIHLFYLTNISTLDFIQFLLNTPQINGLAFLVFWLVLAYLLKSPLSVASVLLCAVFIKLPAMLDVVAGLTYLLPDYNVLLINPVNKVHPGCLYLSVAFLTLNFFKVTSLRSLTVDTHCSTRAAPYFFMLGAAALLFGCWWAFQESSWGGWWVWELSECLLGFIILFYVFMCHTRCTATAEPLYLTLYRVQWFSLYTYWLLVKLFFSTTLHSFFNSSVGTLTALQLGSTSAPLIAVLFITISVNTLKGGFVTAPPRWLIISLLYIQTTVCCFILFEYSVASYQYLVWLLIWWVIITAPTLTTQQIKKEHLVYFAALSYFLTLPLLEFSSSYTQVPTILLQPASSFLTCIDGLFIQALVVSTSVSVPYMCFTNSNSFIFALHQVTSAFHLSIPGAFCFLIALRCDFIVMYVWYLVLNFGFLQLL